MKCPICKLGEMQEGFTQVVLTRGNATVIFRNVPAKFMTTAENITLTSRQHKIFIIVQIIALHSNKKL